MANSTLPQQVQLQQVAMPGKHLTKVAQASGTSITVLPPHTALQVAAILEPRARLVDISVSGSSSEFHKADSIWSRTQLARGPTYRHTLVTRPLMRGLCLVQMTTRLGQLLIHGS